jgi:SAM-dependent MidA family methyltransferase
VVRGAGRRRRPHAAARARRPDRRDRADRRRRRGDRRVPAALRSDRRAGVLSGTAADAIARLIRREGAITFDRFVERALYEPGAGFFETGHGAGRAGRDFVTSPEVGSLFGACVARALDREWRALGEPDPFVVIEAGAGNGRLARDVQRAHPACEPALHYVLVERSAALRDEQRQRLELDPADEALGPFTRTARDDAPSAVAGSGPVFVALDELPALELRGVVLANELLDNLPFGIAQRSESGWLEVRVAHEQHGFAEVVVPAEPGDARALDAAVEGLTVPPGARLPIPRGLDRWFAECGRMLRGGALVVIDYVDDTAGLVARGAGGWLRTYRGHTRGGPPLDAPGEQDITADIAREQLAHAGRTAGFAVEADVAQAEWLRDLGIDELAESGRRTWETRAHVGDLDAIAARSRVVEAAALTDPDGLGAHRVVSFRR